MKTSWRDQILNDFAPQVARLTLVADPDGLLLEEGVLHAIREKGFDLIPFEDNVAFRFAYETKYRSLWDRGEPTDLVVVLRSPAPDLASLPFDLLQAGRKLAFSLGDLFPNLSYPVVATLERTDLEALHHAQEQHKPGVLGDKATKDFVLRHVFEIAPELIKQPADLLRALLRRHYQGQRVPLSLDQRLIEVLRQGEQFGAWGLEEIVPDREAFVGFLQERWGIFLDRAATGSPPAPESVSRLKYRGPAELPFDHTDVRVYIDTLFLEGVLRPVQHDKATVLAGQWCGVGIKVDPDADRQRRLEKLLGTVAASVPAQDAKHQEWFAFAYRWAELLHLWHQMSAPVKVALDQRFGALRGSVDAMFLGWMQSRYGAMHNQPATPPVMVHHVLRAMARGVEEGGKAALVVVDGLALDQWTVLREVLSHQMPDVKLREEAVFTWVPTITSVSRQAIFAGKPPLYFGATIATTDREEKLWSQFWMDQGLNLSEVVYVKKLRDHPDLSTVLELLERPKVRVAGVWSGWCAVYAAICLEFSGSRRGVRNWGC